MKLSSKTISVAILILSIGVILLVFRNQSRPAPVPVQSNQEVKNDRIVVAIPSRGETVRSPLHITGKARGNWYFEASFPIVILDSQGNEIGSGHATAQSEWMTTDFVPFTADVSFKAVPGSEGSVVLKKDNPSGDPSRDEQLVIPAVFTDK